MLKKTLLSLTFAIIVLLAIASTKPDEFRVERSITINAPAKKIFTFLNNPKETQRWSPWIKLDPNAIFTFEGPESGKGAISSWSGNSDMGEGKSTIIESESPTYVKTQLDFLKPMQATNYADFHLTQTGDKTQVTWAMYGNQNLFNKAISLIFNCEKMISTTFEEGLTNLKSISENK